MNQNVWTIDGRSKMASIESRALERNIQSSTISAVERTQNEKHMLQNVTLAVQMVNYVSLENAEMI